MPWPRGIHSLATGVVAGLGHVVPKISNWVLHHGSFVYFWGVVCSIIIAGVATLTQGSWGSDGNVEEVDPQGYCASKLGSCSITQTGIVRFVLKLTIGTAWSFSYVFLSIAASNLGWRIWTSRVYCANADGGPNNENRSGEHGHAPSWVGATEVQRAAIDLNNTVLVRFVSALIASKNGAPVYFLVILTIGAVAAIGGLSHSAIGLTIEPGTLTVNMTGATCQQGRCNVAPANFTDFAFSNKFLPRTPSIFPELVFGRAALLYGSGEALRLHIESGVLSNFRADVSADININRTDRVCAFGKGTLSSYGVLIDCKDADGYENAVYSLRPQRTRFEDGEWGQEFKSFLGFSEHAPRGNITTVLEADLMIVQEVDRSRLISCRYNLTEEKPADSCELSQSGFMTSAFEEVIKIMTVSFPRDRPGSQFGSSKTAGKYCVGKVWWMPAVKMKKIRIVGVRGRLWCMWMRNGSIISANVRPAIFTAMYANGSIPSALFPKVAQYVVQYKITAYTIATLRCVVEARNNVVQGRLRSCTLLNSPSTWAIRNVHESLKKMLDSADAVNYQPDVASQVLDSIMAMEDIAQHGIGMWVADTLWYGIYRSNASFPNTSICEVYNRVQVQVVDKLVLLGVAAAIVGIAAIIVLLDEYLAFCNHARILSPSCAALLYANAVSDTALENHVAHMDDKERRAAVKGNWWDDSLAVLGLLNPVPKERPPDIRVVKGRFQNNERENEEALTERLRVVTGWEAWVETEFEESEEAGESC